MPVPRLQRAQLRTASSVATTTAMYWFASWPQRYNIHLIDILCLSCRLLCNIHMVELEQYAC